MTGRPQVAPTVLYDKQLDKSEFDRILDDKKQSCDEVLSGGAPGRTILIRGEGLRNHRFSIGSTSVPPRVASLVTFLSTQESNAPPQGSRLSTCTARCIKKQRSTMNNHKQLDKLEFGFHSNRKIKRVRIVPWESSLPSHRRSRRSIRAMRSPERFPDRRLDKGGGSIPMGNRPPRFCPARSSVPLQGEGWGIFSDGEQTDCLPRSADGGFFSCLPWSGDGCLLSSCLPKSEDGCFLSFCLP